MKLGSVRARAGGGGHGGSSGGGHGSGGHHSGGSSSGGGGDGDGAFSFVALVVVGLILYFLYRRFSRSTVSTQNVSAAPMARQAVSAVLGTAAGRGLGDFAAAAQGSPARPGLPEALDTVRANDPGFEIETFLQRAEMTFFLVKRGLQRNDAAAIRPYVSDAMFDAVSRNIAQMTAQHRHALMESLNVRGVHLIDVRCDDREQQLEVHFDLVYRAKTLDDANRVLTDEGQDRRHGERWRFARAAAARTPADGGVIASRCPACGAELSLSLAGACLHCRASVTNGSVDWVVADVQPSAFVGQVSDPLLGIAAPSVHDGIESLRATDPSFDMNVFLGRVNTAFMTLQDAWCRQTLDTGRGFLSPGAYFSWAAQLETMAAEGRRDVMENLSVQSIVPLRVVHGRVFDDLTVRITAAAADYEVDAAGRVVFGDRAVRPFTEEWTFQRSVGTATSQKAGTLENTCPCCGAPLALTQIGQCRYCKAAVSSGRFDWVVSRIEQEDGAGEFDSPNTDLGTRIALEAGGALVGGLLSSWLSDGKSR